MVLVPGGLFWTRRRACVGFRWIVPDTHDYFLPRPGRLSWKNGADMIISCGDLRLVGSHRKVVPLSRSGPCGSVGWCSKGCTEPSTYMVLRAVWLVALVFQKDAPEPPPWPVGVFVVALMGWCSKSWGGVPKKLSQNPRWGGVPKVEVVLLKVVPESSRLDGVVFQKLGW